LAKDPVITELSASYCPFLLLDKLSQDKKINYVLNVQIKKHTGKQLDNKKAG
jgi:hypothetical protein